MTLVVNLLGGPGIGTLKILKDNNLEYSNYTLKDDINEPPTELIEKIQMKLDEKSVVG